MAVFKCKMCGGALEIHSGDAVAVCEYCGTKQTLPKLEDERKANLYDRASHFRRNNEFDKAMGIYEQILNEDNTDAESYWSLVLCRYGIEYVEDPSTRKRIPTVNRAQFTSIFDDEDYKSALQYATGAQREVYEQEAAAINEIQKGILAISSQEEPFDVFICYKETDQNGRRTPDSVLATELYHELTREGYKVFFSRITLEDKLGSAYEPYIFAALNSAKVMVVIGTRPEYFGAVWVKNEWSRYLALIKGGARKMLIPAYRDMDPYDLPEEFSHLQAQDMTKLGFMQDLIRGISKIIGADTPAPAVVTQTVVAGESLSANLSALLKRGFMALEDGEWDKADDFFEQSLNQDAELAEAYLGKLMIQLQVMRPEELVEQETPFDNNNYFNKVMRYADAKLKSTMNEYIDTINNRVKEARLSAIYHEAKALMEEADSDNEYGVAAAKFEMVPEYLDSAALATECRRLAEIAHDEEIYQDALYEQEKIFTSLSVKVSSLKSAVYNFKKIPHYKDSAERIEKIEAEIEETVQKMEDQEAERKAYAKKLQKWTRLIFVSILALVFLVLLLIYVILPACKYGIANKQVDNQNYEKAIATYTALGDYKDSSEKILSTRYLWAEDLLGKKEYQESIAVYSLLGDYKDASDKIVLARYLCATEHLKNKEYKPAYELFDRLNDYKDSKKKHQESGYGYAKELMNEKKFADANTVFGNIGDYKDSTSLKNQCCMTLAKKCYANKDYSNAIVWYQRTKSFSKTAKFYQDTCYKLAVQKLGDKDYIDAVEYFQKAGNYKDAKTKINATKYAYVKANKNNDNKTTYKYLKQLKAAGYKDSAKIYSQLYKWRATIAVNNSEDDSSTHKTSVSSWSGAVYVHFTVTGGTPGSSFVPRYVITMPTGKISKDTMDSKYYDGNSGSVYWSNGIYDYPGVSGTMRIKIYKGSQLIGQKNVKLTY